MRDQINYGQKKKMNKKLKIVLIVMLVMILAYLIIQSIIRTYRSLAPQKSSDGKVAYHSVGSYNSLKQLLNNYGCSYISEKTVDGILIINVKFDRDLYTDKKSNEKYFTDLLKIIAEFENYKNFELIDETRNIDIKVNCQNKSITQIEINGDTNYFLNNDSKINSLKQDIKITNFTVDSSELQALIGNNWSTLNVNLGTRESICNNYSIYFDEGIKVKTVGRKVYNIIYTEKYRGNVAGGLAVTSSAEEVKNALGEPTFSDGINIYGYVSENNYLFFDFLNKEISIYPVISIDSNEEKKFMELIKSMSSSDEKTFTMELTSLWTDYDIYDYASNYADLVYTLRGVEFSISGNSLKNGIYIFQNYKGNRDIQKLDNVYIRAEDSVWEAEKIRSSTDLLNRVEQGEFAGEESNLVSSVFSIRFKNLVVNDVQANKGAMFYSKDKSYPDSELDSTVILSSYVWYDDYSLIYSVDNDGIYYYNPETRVSQKIIDLDDEIKINDASNGQIIYNDNQVLYINFN